MDDQSRTFLIDLIVVAKSINSEVLQLLSHAEGYLKEVRVDSNIIIVHHHKQKNIEIPRGFLTISTQRHSAARSRNLALKEVKNEAVIFLDDDTLTNSEWANNIRRFLEATFIDIVCFNTGSETSTFNVSSLQNGRLFKADTAGMGIKISLFKSGLKFDETFKRAEDCDLVTTAIRMGFICWFCETKIFDKNKDGFIKRLILKRKNNFYMKRLFNKHFSTTKKVKMLKKNFVYLFKGQKIQGNIYILNSALVIDQVEKKFDMRSYDIIEKNNIRIITEI